MADAILADAALAGVDLADVPVEVFLADAVWRAGALVVFVATDFTALAGATGFADVFPVGFAVADAVLAGVDFLATAFTAVFTGVVVFAGFFVDADFDAAFFAVAGFVAAAFGATAA